jgi:hypothetical protein
MPQINYEHINLYFIVLLLFSHVFFKVMKPYRDRAGECGG